MRGACYQCPDRHLGCHADCEKYLEEVRAREEVRKKKEQFYDGIERYLNDKRRRRRRWNYK